MNNGLPDRDPTYPRSAPAASERRLLVLLECAGPLTRAQLADRSGLPRTTVTGLAAKLLAAGVLAERVSAGEEHGVGRPPRTLALAGAPPLVVVLLPGQMSMAGILATYAGEFLAEATVELQPDEDEQRRLGGPAADLVADLLQRADCTRDRLGVAVLSVARPCQPDEPTAWLEDLLGVPVLCENDANLGALGEAAFGAGRGRASLVFVKLGRNVGSGLVLDGRLLRGASGFAGELCHVQVREDGALCHCGGRGCLSTLVGPSLLDFARRAYEERVGMPEVLALAAEREPSVRRVFADLGRTVGRPLAAFCTMVDPNAVVIDGSLGAAGDLVVAGIRESIDRFAAPVVADSVSVLRGELGDRAEALGGVRLACQARLARAGLPAGPGS